MATIDKQYRDELLAELAERYTILREILVGRDLASPSEGLSKGFWKAPDKRAFVSSMKLSLALGDFKNILAFIGKVK